MKTALPGTALVAAISVLAAGQAQADPLEFDQNVTPNVINGSGIANGAWTIGTGNNGDIELGLRGKLRFNDSGNAENTFNSNGDGTYSFNTGGPGGGRAEWSYEWSINSSLSSDFRLDDYTYQLSLDQDPGAGTNFISFDPIWDIEPGKGLTEPYWDHALGNNSTGEGDGYHATDSADYVAALGSNTVAQNSWQPHWHFPIFDPNVDGLYDFSLTAFSGENVLANTRMQIIVGEGAAVPAPAPLLLLGAGLLGLGLSRWRKASRA